MEEQLSIPGIAEEDIAEFIEGARFIHTEGAMDQLIRKVFEREFEKGEQTVVE